MQSLYGRGYFDQLMASYYHVASFNRKSKSDVTINRRIRFRSHFIAVVLYAVIGIRIASIPVNTNSMVHFIQSSFNWVEISAMNAPNCPFTANFNEKNHFRSHFSMCSIGYCNISNKSELGNAENAAYWFSFSIALRFWTCRLKMGPLGPRDSSLGARLLPLHNNSTPKKQKWNAQDIRVFTFRVVFTTNCSI